MPLSLFPSLKLKFHQQQTVVIIQSNFQQQAPENVDIARPIQTDQAVPPPDNWMGCAILSLFCCLIFGIVAITNASKVGKQWSTSFRKSISLCQIKIIFRGRSGRFIYLTAQ